METAKACPVVEYILSVEWPVPDARSLLGMIDRLGNDSSTWLDITRPRE
jgi:hypothetical protein